MPGQCEERSKVISAIRLKQLSAVLAVAGFVACAGSDITSPKHVTPVATQNLGGGLTPSLMQCPTNETQTASGLVSPLGGSVSVGGTTIAIPAGALLASANVTVTVPASNYLEVDVSIDGVPHFLFELPVTITVSYDRCSRANIDKAPLSVWYIDSDTHALLEQMGGIDDKVARTVTFLTGHLSGYAVAN